MDDYYDLGAYGRKVTTSSPAAQRWFDRGLNWIYSFNQEEAARCFRRASEADPDCAMAWWGLAYALGPYYNRVWEKFDAAELGKALRGGFDAAQAALARRAGASPPNGRSSTRSRGGILRRSGRPTSAPGATTTRTRCAKPTGPAPGTRTSAPCSRTPS